MTKISDALRLFSYEPDERDELFYFLKQNKQLQARRSGGSRGSNEPPWQVNDEGLKTQAVNFQLLANSQEMGNKPCFSTV